MQKATFDHNFFSVVIITRDRPVYLQKCLQSLLQFKNDFSFSIWIGIRGSDLETFQVINELKPLFARLNLINLPYLMPGGSRNSVIQQIKLAEIKSEWIFLIDDDAYCEPNYYLELKSFLKSHPTVEAFGGIDQTPMEQTGWAQALGECLQSPFCLGPTFKRHTFVNSRPFKTDSSTLTSCNLWVKTKYFEQEYFPEKFERAEETYFLISLSKQIDLWSVPMLKVRHYRRNDLLKIIQVALKSGFWRAQFSGKNSIYFFLPSLFVFLHFVIFLNLKVFYIFVIAWFILIIASQLRRKKYKNLLRILFLHWAIPFFYGLGFLKNQLLGKFYDHR